MITKNNKKNDSFLTENEKWQLFKRKLLFKDIIISNGWEIKYSVNYTFKTFFSYITTLNKYINILLELLIYSHAAKRIYCKRKKYSLL